MVEAACASETSTQPDEHDGVVGSEVRKHADEQSTGGRGICGGSSGGGRGLPLDAHVKCVGGAIGVANAAAVDLQRVTCDV
jgi:hypothetical protein